jgi:hypothetical protein
VVNVKVFRDGGKAEGFYLVAKKQNLQGIGRFFYLWISLTSPLIDLSP